VACATAENSKGTFLRDGEKDAPQIDQNTPRDKSFNGFAAGKSRGNRVTMTQYRSRPAKSTIKAPPRLLKYRADAGASPVTPLHSIRLVEIF